MTPRELILNWLESRLDAQAAAWLKDKSSQISTGAPDKTLYLSFSGAARHSGKTPLHLAPADLQAAAVASEGWDPSDWTCDVAARISLLLSLPESAAHLVGKMYETADVGEAVALQKALPLLPGPEAHMAQARDGIRSNIQSVYEAVTLRNPYPALRFDDVGWNQMVTKTFFMGSPLRQVWGLERRVNAALGQILADLAHERWAAGRTFAPDLWRCVGPVADARALQDLGKVIAQGSPAEKRAAALALKSCPDAAAAALLDAHPDLAAAARGGALTWENYDIL